MISLWPEIKESITRSTALIGRYRSYLQFIQALFPGISQSQILWFTVQFAKDALTNNCFVLVEAFITFALDPFKPSSVLTQLTCWPVLILPPPWNRPAWVVPLVMILQWRPSDLARKSKHFIRVFIPLSAHPPPSRLILAPSFHLDRSLTAA